jgi:hypothetical protein
MARLGAIRPGASSLAADGVAERHETGLILRTGRTEERWRRRDVNSAPPDREYIPCHDHIPGLDGLRGIAALLVLWDHLPDTLGGPLHNKIKTLF